MTAQEMRQLARETVFSCGGRGFVRFAGSGGALLVCDAARRCSEGEAQRMAAALEARGFAVSTQDGLMLISPGDAMIAEIGAQEPPQVLWNEPDYAVQALAARLLKAPKLPLTPAGRALAIESLRLTGRPGEDVLAGLGALRAQAAVMLRSGDRSGMHEAGAILKTWCDGRNGHED